MIGYAGLTVLVLLFFNPSTKATGNIGCLFSETLCGQDQEWCFEDDAFGRCMPLYDHVREEDLHRYDLNTDQLHLLEQEMQRLFLLGYRWSHTYTQCILQALLNSMRYNTDYNASSCNDELDQDLEGALKAIEGEEMEHVNPQDLAIVRFTPSENDPHSAYADEVYLPHIKERLESLAKQSKGELEFHEDHQQQQENHVLGNEIKSEDQDEELHRLHEERNNENNIDNNNQDNNIIQEQHNNNNNNNNNNRIQSSPHDTFFPARPQHNEVNGDEDNYINNYYNHDYEFEDPYSSQYNFYNNDDNDYNRNYYKKRSGEASNDFRQFAQHFNDKEPLKDTSYISSAINYYPYQDQDIFAGVKEQQMAQDGGVYGVGNGYVPSANNPYDPSVYFNNDLLNPKQAKAYADFLESMGPLNNVVPRLDGNQEIFIPDKFFLQGLKNEEELKDGLFRERPAVPMYTEGGQAYFPEIQNQNEQALPISLQDFTPEQLLAILPPEMRPLENEGIMYPKAENAMPIVIPEGTNRFSNLGKSHPVVNRGGFEYQPTYYGSPNYNEKSQEIFKLYPFLRERFPQPETEEEMLLKQLIEEPANQKLMENLDDSLKKIIKDDGFATDLKKPTNTLRDAFGEQLNELGEAYSQDYPDYPSLMLNYPDYSEFIGPVALPYKELAKKDEETINSDFNGDFMYQDLNYQRPVRYDVKKPGPYFNSHNNYAFNDQLGLGDGLVGPVNAEYETVLMRRLGLARKPNSDAIDQQEFEAYEEPDVIRDFPVDEEDLVDEAREKLPILKEMNPPRQKARNDKKLEDTKSEVKPEAYKSDENKSVEIPEKEDQQYFYIHIKNGFMSDSKGSKLVKALRSVEELKNVQLKPVRIRDKTAIFKVEDADQSADEIAKKIDSKKKDIEEHSGLEFDVGTASETQEIPSISEVYATNQSKLFVASAIICGVMVFMLTAAVYIYQVKRRMRTRAKLQGLAGNDTEASKDYEDLCRARKFSGSVTGEGKKDGNLQGQGGHYCDHRVNDIKLSKDTENGNSPSSTRTSTSSWSEEPVASNMDISTGHMVLSYMEDHLKRKDRLEKEWISLCGYEPDGSCATTIALNSTNKQKNRYLEAVPYDLNRVTLNTMANSTESDYINASSITDHDPRNPAYIATQGPLASTACDFWQMVWERGSVVIVMLTRLTENGQELCHHYWPKEGSELYHIYEVHLVSEHIWCDDYLVRSFYLKNNRTGETRTVTQFHFLSWPESGIPASTKALLEFRRKVNKSYRGRCCPVIVHCSDGIGRTGTYCLIDMVLNRTVKGAKEIDIAATLEHIRDQRPGMVKTKSQFEFVLMSVAEEVHAILKALPQ